MWKEKQRQAISQLNEHQTRLIWDDEGASNHLTFRSLDSSARFTDIKEVLKAYASISFSGGKVSLCALLALTINDYTCHTGIPGTFKIYHAEHYVRFNRRFKVECVIAGASRDMLRT